MRRCVSARGLRCCAAALCSIVFFLLVGLTRGAAQADALANGAMDSRASHAWSMDEEKKERSSILDFAWEVMARDT